MLWLGLPPDAPLKFECPLIASRWGVLERINLAFIIVINLLESAIKQVCCRTGRKFWRVASRSSRSSAPVPSAKSTKVSKASEQSQAAASSRREPLPWPSKPFQVKRFERDVGGKSTVFSTNFYNKPRDSNSGRSKNVPLPLLDSYLVGR